MFESGMMGVNKHDKQVDIFYNNKARHINTITSREHLLLWCKYVAGSIEKAAYKINIGYSTLAKLIRGKTCSYRTAEKIYKKTGIRIK